MYTRTVIPLIDGHLDLSLNALCFNRDLSLDLSDLNSREAGMKDHPCRSNATITYPELRRAGLVACLGTVLARVNPSLRPASGFARHDLDYSTPEIAAAVAIGQAAYYTMCAGKGLISPIRTASELSTHMDRYGDWLSAPAPTSTSQPTGEPPPSDPGKAPAPGLVLAMEGADPILDSDDLSTWWKRGLRAVGLCHYGHSRFAVGTGADGPLTDAGRELLHAMAEFPCILDLTHLSDTSFWEAIEIYEGPVMASHNNCRALVAGNRQFDDKQILAIFKRDGVIGVALDAWMLYSGWSRGSTKPDVLDLGVAANHIDHMCRLAGTSARVAIGSDLDGGFGSEQTPRDVKSVADLQKLGGILAQRGYTESDIRGIFYRNWLHFLLKNLPD